MPPTVSDASVTACVASATDMAATAGTACRSGPFETTADTVESRRASAPGVGSVEMIFPAGTVSL